MGRLRLIKNTGKTEVQSGSFVQKGGSLALAPVNRGVCFHGGSSVLSNVTPVFPEFLM